MNLCELFLCSLAGLLIAIFMELILLIGGKNCDSARKVRMLRKANRVVGSTSLSGVKGMPT